MDKIEQFIKKNKGCPLTPAATKQLLTKFMEFLGKELPGMIEEGSGTSLKVGTYIYDDENNKLVCVEAVPEDYSGVCYYIGDDLLEISDFTYGENKSTLSLSPSEGVNIISLPALTHSLNELDPTLKQIVDDAIADADADGVACTQEQWKAIKSLLDKSLYLHYNGYSMIKSSTDGINLYVFGVSGAITGCTLDLVYDNDHLLYAKCVEV